MTEAGREQFLGGLTAASGPLQQMPRRSETEPTSDELEGSNAPLAADMATHDLFEHVRRLPRTVRAA